MLFNTINFAIFLPIVIILYYSISHKYRWILLLTASYIFYMSWRVEYIFLIVISTLIDYFSGLMMEKRPDRKSRLPFLIISLISNLGILFFFKYYNFASDNINFITSAFNYDGNMPIMNFLLPVGISFYTFQTLSYSIDVYLGKQKAERHLGYFALYVSFFPQLVAGPIERFSRLTPQFKAKHKLTYDNLANGLRLILYGLFIKMVIADNLAVIVDKVYSSPESFSTINLLTGLFFYSFQIYSDFYGYSIIAIGSALIMGIKIIDNFKTPYLAKNIAEFWQRWHISLSTWFRDYLYFPLGGNKSKKFRWVLNIIVVFIVSGIWHGANWTFLIWGGVFGLLYLLEKITNSWLKLKNESSPFSLGHIALALKTFVLVTFIWVFFRSQNFNEAINIFELVFKNINVSGIALQIPIATWIFLVVFIITDILLYNNRFDTWVSPLPYLLRWTVYGILLFSIIVFPGVENFPFIYFQF
jgi:alginate O-acetyltransferase complex protein AlgI